MSKQIKKGYKFDPDILDALTALADKEDRSETFIINRELRKALISPQLDFKEDKPIAPAIKKEKKQPTIPTVEEVTQFFVSEGYAVLAAETFYKYYYQDGNGKDKNENTVLNWKQKARVNWFPRLPKTQPKSNNNEYKEFN